MLQLWVEQTWFWPDPAYCECCEDCAVDSRSLSPYRDLKHQNNNHILSFQTTTTTTTFKDMEWIVMPWLALSSESKWFCKIKRRQTFTVVKADGHLVTDNAGRGGRAGVADDRIALVALLGRHVGSVLYQPAIRYEVSRIRIDIWLSVAPLIYKWMNEYNYYKYSNGWLKMYNATK